jgi:Ca2+-binding RTX toxin-like protein
MSDSFEYLERRRMFAAYPTQPLVIPCTDGPDTISIAQSGDFLQVRNNRVLSFHRWKGYFIPGPTPNSPPIAVPGISKVVVNAGWGDDVLNVDTTVTIPIEARGQHGDDSLVGGMNNDTLYGGDSNSSNDFGDDTLVGRDGNDTLRAAYVGNGHINAGNGNDTIVAGNGRDSVYAGDGNDVIWGDDVTELENEGAADTLNGEGGNDTIHSGEGPDNVDGGAGNDLLFNSIRNDNFVGGGKHTQNGVIILWFSHRDPNTQFAGK